MTSTNQVGEPAEKPIPVGQLSAYSSNGEHIKDIVDLSESRNRRRIIIGIGVAFLLLLAGSPWWWPASRAYLTEVQIERIAASLKGEQLRLWNEAKGGNRESRLQLASKLSEKDEPNTDHELARKLLEQAANGGDALAALMLGHRFKEGSFGEKDANAARNWYKRAYELADDGARIGDAPSMWILGHLYASGLHVELDVSKGRELMIAAASKDPKKYAEDIARNLEYGRSGFPKDRTAAVLWYEKFAEAGLASDAYDIANNFQVIAYDLENEGAKPEVIAEVQRKAIKLLNKAAEGGNQFAMFELAKGILEKEKLFVGSAQDGEKWLAKAVAAGCSDALIYEGLRALQRESADEIPGKADDLFLRAWKSKRAEVVGKPFRRDVDKEFVRSVFGGLFKAPFLIFDDSGKIKGHTQPIRWAAWSHANTTLAETAASHMWALDKSSLSKARLLRDQILQFAKGADLPDRWPRVSAEVAGANIERPNGYLSDERQTFEAGLSTFSVDNSDGAVDAEVRLYRGEMRIRSFFVRVGSTFTADKLPPGTYRFRYKINVNGKITVFEAKEDFVLTETSIENGTRASKMSVTLFKVPNGNLQMAEVSLDRF